MFNEILYKRPSYLEDAEFRKNNLVYPFHSVMDIIDANYTREDLEMVIIKHPT